MIEVLATGLGPNVDLATFEALKRAVEQETRVMVESRVLVENHRVLDDTIVTQQAGVVTGYQVRSIRQTSDGTFEVHVVAQVDEMKLKGVLQTSATSSSLDGSMLAIQMEQSRRKQGAEREDSEREEALAKAIRRGDPIATKLLVPEITQTEVADDYSGLKVRVEVDHSRVTLRAYDDWRTFFGPYQLEVRALDKEGTVVTSVCNEVWSPCFAYNGTPRVGTKDPWWYYEGDFLDWWVKIPATPDQVAQVKRIEARWAGSKER